MKNILFLFITLFAVSACMEPLSDSLQAKMNSTSMAIGVANRGGDQLRRSAPKYYLNHGDTLYDLTNAHLYLTLDEPYVPTDTVADDIRNYRVYTISDGIYTGSYGSYGEQVQDYTGATYALTIEIFSSEKHEKLTPGNYLQDFWFNYVYQPKRWGWIYLEQGIIGQSWQIIQASELDTLHSIVLERSIEPNHLMKISYSGILSRTIINPPSVIANELPSQLLFEGVVEDRRNLGSTNTKLVYASHYLKHHNRYREKGRV